MRKVHTFQRSLQDFKQQQKKRKKRGGVITNARGGGRGTIFRLSGILPKITDGTNGERCTLFRAVCRTLRKKKKKKWNDY